MEFWGEFWDGPTIRSYFSTLRLAIVSSRFKFSFSCRVSAKMAASWAGLLVDEGEGADVRPEGREFRGEVVMGVLEEEGRGPDEVIVIVDIVGGSDGCGGSVGGCGRRGALMEGGLGEAVDIDLDGADDSQDGRG